MKRAQVAACFIFVLQQYHAARIYVDPYYQVDLLDLNDENLSISNGISDESLSTLSNKYKFDNHHLHTEMIKTFPLIKTENDRGLPNYEGVQFLKRGRGSGRANRRAEARAARAETRANAVYPAKKQQPAAQAKPAAEQHHPPAEAAKKGGISKGKGALLVAGGAAAGAAAVHAMSGGGGGDPNAPAK